VPLSNHNNESATYAFLDMVFSRFGVLVEVFIDQNMKFHGEVQELCEKTPIDPCTISWDHFEANMLAKRMMEMVKHGLWKYGLQKGHNWDWDL